MLKRIIAIGMSAMLVSSAIPSFADTSMIDLDTAVQKSIEVNANIRTINANIPAIEEGIRKATEGANRMQELYDSYDTYKIMYYDDDDTYDRLIDMDSAELMEEMSDLSVRIMNSKSPSKIEQMLHDIDFITYALTFGNEEPDLTEVELYHKFVKSIETIGLQAQNEYDKTLNNIDLIKGNVTVGVTSVYLGILDLEKGLEVQNELLDLRTKIQDELNIMFDEGLISEFDLYSNQVEVDKLKLEIKKLEYQLDGLYYNLNNLLALDVEADTNILSSIGQSYYTAGTSMSAYSDMAIENSPTLKALRIDLNYYKKNLELYEAHDGYDFGAEYEELTYQIEKFSSQLQEAEWKLENNVRYALGDIIAKQEVIEKNEIALQNAGKQYQQVLQQKDLGLVKQTDVHSAELNMQSAKMTLSQSERALKSALVKLDMLVDYGIEY